MGKKIREPSPFGKFIKELREKKGVTLRDIEEVTGISNVYICQLETGARKKVPSPDNLQALAEYFGVTLKELLEKAGYVEPQPTEETDEQKIEKAFPHVLSDPDFKYGTRIKGNCDIDTKRFIIEMYEKTTGRKLL